MVTTETSKVHNDYEFTPTKEILPKIISQRPRDYRNMNMIIISICNTLINAVI